MSNLLEQTQAEINMRKKAFDFPHPDGTYKIPIVDLLQLFKTIDDLRAQVNFLELTEIERNSDE